MLKHCSLLSCVVVTLFFSLSGLAQQPPDSSPLPTPVDPATLGPQNAAFYQAHQPLAEKIKKLYLLMQEYQKATPERRDAIVAEYQPLNTEAEEAGKKMIDLAIAAFNEAPFKNFDVVTFLAQMAMYEFDCENYENSFKIFNALMRDDKPDEMKKLLVPAAESAFNVMELDKAEAWYQEAAAFRPLSQESVYHQRSIPQYRKFWDAELAIREKEAAADNLPIVLLRTNKGDIKLLLYEDQAPNTVANFISLVEKGFYTNIPFHRVLKNFMAQGGNPGNESGGPGYMIDDECVQKPGGPIPRIHFRGSISMANAGPNTNGSQFFLTFVPTSHLDGKHTVFGRIIEGIDVLGDLERIDPDEQIPVVADRIVEAQVLRKRNHPYEPVKNNRRR